MKPIFGLILALVLVGCGRSVDVAEIAVPSVVADDAEVRAIDGFAVKLLPTYLGWQAMTGERAGFAVLAARDGKVQYAATAGYADIAQEIPFQIDTRARIASMTKPVAAVAALQLVEQGKLGLDDEVAKYIPAFANSRVAIAPERNADGEFDTEPLARPLTLRDLLEFRAGMGDVPVDAEPGTPKSALDQAWDSWFDKAALLDLEQRANLFSAVPLQEQPGVRWRYGYYLDVVARIVEIVSGQAFEDYLEHHIFSPLGMTQTSFMPPPDAREGLAQVYGYDESGDLITAADREWDVKGRVYGSGGLVSTAPDYLRFALMLWNRGSYNGVQILKPETVDLMTQLHVPSGVLRNFGMDGLGWGLGIGVVADSEKTPFPSNTGDFYWSGFYGSHFWVSQKTGLVFVYMTQQDPSVGDGFSRGQSIPYVVQAMLMKSLD